MSHINTVDKLKQHFLKDKPKHHTCICPAILAYKFARFINEDTVAHVMVATGITSKVINDKIEDFVQCKNSYREDPAQAG